MYFFTAPSGPPTNCSTLSVTKSSITLQWGPVECIHRNGEITGYIVQYGVYGSETVRNMSVPGGDTNKATILGLKSATTYSIEVAAMNRNGTGVFNAPLIATTQGIV